MIDGMDKTIGVYVHIPFCVKKCPYCDFNSIAVAGLSEGLYDRYIDAVIEDLVFQIKARPALSERVLETIYMGGGTPSLLSAENMKRLVSGIREGFPASGQQEITVEVNPGTATLDKLTSFIEAGINRLSIGIQSFNGEGLNSLGRVHSVQDSLNCYEDARSAGFDNIGIDLIFGIPGQSVAGWEADVDKAICLRPEHLSTYNLTIEQGTPFFKMQKEGRPLLPTEEDQIRMYELGIERLISAGYHHYEISNFSLDGFESRHNNRYWLAEDYLGLGAGAHSYLAVPDWGVRWWNDTDPLRYIQFIKDTGRATEGMERLTREEAITEGIFLGLRRMKGIDLDWFQERFGVSLKSSCTNEITALEAGGLLNEAGNQLRLTHKGILMSNSVIAALIE